MKFYTQLPKSLQPHFEQELLLYKNALVANHLKQAWTHLENAHIIGQRYPLTHTSVHWKMLKFGFKIKSRKEIFGQIPRLVFGGVKSFVGTVPVGNPGGANVPPLKPFPIQPHIQAIFDSVGVK